MGSAAAAAGSRTRGSVASTEGYDLYFRSGVYERRYPAPNRSTMRLVEQLVGNRAARVLDFGCGSGRYAIPLAMRRPVHILAYDPCTTALALLAERAERAGVATRIRAISGSLAELERVADTEGRVDVALILFGVLGHIRYREERLRHLRAVRAAMAPDGRLVVSVPNAARRFWREQAAPARESGLEPGDIFYDRQLDQTSIRLFYHLYRMGELEQELAEAGFRALSTRSESILPEWMIARGSLAAKVDAVLMAIAPVRLGYGFLTVAAPDGG